MQSFSLNSLAVEALAAAQGAPNGRSAKTLHIEAGSDAAVAADGTRARAAGGALRQTLLALIAGQGLSEHESPGDATLLVLRGRVQLSTAGESWDGTVGDLLVIPPERHELLAVDDSAVLLTVYRQIPLS